MLGLTAAKVFTFISQYLPRITIFTNNKPAASTYHHGRKDLKGFQILQAPTNHTQQNFTLSDETDSGAGQITEPYEKIVSAPLEYLLSLPGKDIRGKLISAFNEWFHLPDYKLAIVKEVIDRLHTASLLIDDIQDASRLRRGHPVAHDVFGIAQTINAANYAYFLQQERLNEINDPRAFHIFTQALLDLHIGQGMDLYWRDALVCPTAAEYTRMVMYKTGGLFRLAVELMQIQSTTTTDLSRLVGLLGIIFQIRDDYMNLQSGIYAEKKGLMEDLTEGKFSYPVIHSIRADPDNTQLINILKQRSEDRAVKVRAVEYMESTGSFQHCREVLSGLMEQARGHVDELEILLGPNQGIHRILDLLQVYPPNVNPRP